MTVRQLLQSLVDHKAKFVIIGAYALPAQGYSRSTLDIDIFYEPNKENIKRIVEAVRECGYLGLEDLTEEQLKKKKTLFRQYVLDLDIHPFVAGVTFDEVWKTRKKAVIEGVKVYVPSLDALIAMKRAAGRPKDLADLEYLEEIKRQTSKRK